ncbi:MAG: HupE / UreJ protein [Flavobacteriaceae bacterium]|nr:HupE / UreJ protein [Flavobacteriaceae bacterium]
MSDFTFYLELGLLHVLDIKAYDHMLFLVALTVPFSFKKFKTVFWIVTFFTFGHTFSLFMSAYEIYRPNETLIETLIPVTIILTALGNVIFIGRREYNKLSSFFISLIFGVIHGFGFGNYFNQISFPLESKVQPLIGFSAGVELSQLVVVLFILLFNFIILEIFNFKDSKYTTLVSVFIIGFSFNMILNNF